MTFDCSHTAPSSLWACASYTSSFKGFHAHGLVKDAGGTVAVGCKTTSFKAGSCMLMLFDCVPCRWKFDAYSLTGAVSKLCRIGRGRGGALLLLSCPKETGFHSKTFMESWAWHCWSCLHDCCPSFDLGYHKAENMMTNWVQLIAIRHSLWNFFTNETKMQHHSFSETLCEVKEQRGVIHALAMKSSLFQEKKNKEHRDHIPKIYIMAMLTAEQ